MTNVVSDRVQRDKTLLKRCYWISRALTWGTIFLISRFVILFDTSPHISQPDSPSALLRWDSFHFSQIALKGYTYEHEFAFLPGTPAVMRGGAELGMWLGRVLHLSNRVIPTDHDVLQAGAIVSFFLCDWTGDLYDLTLQYSASPSFALLASLLSLLPLSPATVLFAPYAEPFFAVLSMKGMLACARDQWGFAALCFMAAATFRSNGIMLVGFIIWGLVVEPAVINFLGRKRVVTLRIIRRAILATLLAGIVCLPFAAYQYYAYTVFCTDSTHSSARFAPRPWCHRRLPLIYSFVQDHYWNVGLFRYWTVAQLPNFLMAAPVLSLLVLSSTTQLRLLYGSLWATSPLKDKINSWEWKTLPHAIHTLVLWMLLLFASHTQIVLRLSSSLPFTYWAAATLLVGGSVSGRPSKEIVRSHSRPEDSMWWGKVWVWYALVWGSVSLVLWTAFLPPA